MSNFYRILFLIFLGIVVNNCDNQPKENLIANQTDNEQLRILFDEDQATRKGEEIERTDGERRKLVMIALASNKIITANDKKHAAMVLQHTGLTFCDDKLVSVSVENYLLAHELYKEAFESGLIETGWMVAATIDRYLSFTKGYQKYGTNRIINQETGIEELVHIDRNVTDIERAKYGVPPLEDLLKKYPEQKKEM